MRTPLLEGADSALPVALRRGDANVPRLLRQAALLLALSVPSQAVGQTVMDSVQVTRTLSHYTQIQNQWYYCGGWLYATWPNDAEEVLGRAVSYGEYTLVATDGQWVPKHFQDIVTNPPLGIVVPEGHYGFSTGVTYSAGNPPWTTDFDDCSEGRARAQAINGGGQTVINGIPVRFTDWYAVYAVPDGTPAGTGCLVGLVLLPYRAAVPRRPGRSVRDSGPGRAIVLCVAHRGDVRGGGSVLLLRERRQFALVVLQPVLEPPCRPRDV